MKRADTIIAESLAWDRSDVCRYQMYTNPTVYVCGHLYFAVHATKPRHSDVGKEWKPYSDQFGARGTNRIIWVTEPEEMT